MTVLQGKKLVLDDKAEAFEILQFVLTRCCATCINDPVQPAMFVFEPFKVVCHSQSPCTVDERKFAIDPIEIYRYNR